MRFLIALLILVMTPFAALGQQHDMHASEMDHEAMHAMHHGPADLRAEVETAIDRLFDGMRAGDSTQVASVVSRTASLLTTFERDGTPIQRRTPMTAFLQAVGTPHDQVWDERVWNLRVDVRDNLASAWMDYAFFVGDTFSHCGVNAMHLARRADGAWEIIALADTRRMPDACELPDDIRTR